MNPLLNIAIRAVRKGGDLIAQNYDSINYNRDNNINYDKDYTVINILKKKIFYVMLKIIHDSYPNHAVLNIKNKKNTSNKNEIKWFINVLDGKKNFFHKIPYFCLSIVIQNNQSINFSIIYDPIKNDLFTAIKGKGAQLNGYRIRCKKYNHFAKNIIAINCNQIDMNSINLCMLITKTLLKEKMNIRNFGCSTLDLAYLASGKIDAYIDFKYKQNDNVSGELQVRESGALIANLFNNFNDTYKRNILIGHAKIVEFIAKKIYFIKKLVNQKNKK